jgi:cell division protein FtsB
MKIKSTEQLNRQIRLLKRENEILKKENNSIKLHNKLVVAMAEATTRDYKECITKYKNLVNDVKKSFPTFTI